MGPCRPYTSTYMAGTHECTKKPLCGCSEAIELGYRHIDCAAVYSNQDKVGEGLRDFLKQGRREELFIVSKVWNDEHQPDKVRSGSSPLLLAD